MPSLMIHLLVGEKYCEKNKVKDKIKFLKGNFAPDLVKDKKESHFSRDCEFKTFTDALVNKVDLSKVAKTNLNLADDFDRGVFLHLLTDYYFYTQLLINDPNYEKYKNETFEGFRDLMYQDYSYVANWIVNNFENLNYNLLPDFATVKEEGEMQIFSERLLLQIVDLCSNLNLEEMYETIKTPETIK